MSSFFSKVSVLVASLFSLTAFAQLDFTPQKPVITQQTEKTSKGHVSMTENNTVVLRGEISAESTGKALLQVLQVKGDTVHLFLSSPGGSVIDGLNFITGLRGSGKHIVCLTDFSASMSFVIMQACNERIVFDSTIMMQHVPSMGARGEYPNFKSFIGLLDEVTIQTDKAQAKRLGISVEEFRRNIRDDLWLFGAQSVKYKAADRVGTASCSQSMIDGQTKETMRVFMFSVNVTWSNCPLVQAPLDVNVSMGLSLEQEAMVNKELNRIINFRSEMIKDPSQYQGK